MASPPNAVVRSLFVTGLKNAHAVERQALALMDRQIDRLVHYPELTEQLRAHRIETERQIARIEEVLHGLGESPSAIKDMALGMMGLLAALSNAMAGDEVLKDALVNCAFERFEVASYVALVALAEEGGFAAAAPLLEESLREERAMADWAEQAVPAIVRKHLALRAEGRPAGR